MASRDTVDVPALLNQIGALAKNPPKDVMGDDLVRRKLRDASYNLSIALESPADSVNRITYLVQLLLPASAEVVHCVLLLKG